MEGNGCPHNNLRGQVWTLLTGLDGGRPLHADGPGLVWGLIGAVGGRRQRLALEGHRGTVARVHTLRRVDTAVRDGLTSPKLPMGTGKMNSVLVVRSAS